MSGDKAIAVRKPPVEAVFALHPQGVRGSCQRCGKEVTERTEVRGWLKFWHDDCKWEFQIVTMPEMARRAVLDRDHGVCADCGENWSEAVRFIPDQYVGRWRDPEDHPERFTPGPGKGTWVWLSFSHGAPYVSLREVSLWHVDHHNSLESAVRLPPLQRIEFFKLANMKTRCDPCHKRKSAKEAVQRAHFRELAGENKEKSSRKIPPRAFQRSGDPWRKNFEPKVRRIDRGE